MPDQLPPPGPERDAEIARALGWTPRRCPPDAGVGFFVVVGLETGEERDHWKAPDGTLAKSPPPYSTDPAACERLERELLARGFGIKTAAAQPRAEEQPVYEVVIANPTVRRRAFGRSRPDAVSAAALLALRSAS